MDSNMDSMIIENEMIVPVSIEFGEDFSREELDQLCRLCGNSSHQLMPIFSGDGNEHKLPDKIREHLPIIEVSKSDTLPLSMCYQCASTLISWHELYYACKEADQRLKELCARLNLRKSKSDEDLMDIHESSLENDDDIDSFETTELPREQGTPSKSEIIVPGELKEETTFDDTYNVSESFVEKTEESVTIETNNSTITESQYSSATNQIVANFEKESHDPLARKCIVCDADVQDDVKNDLLCATCLQEQPDLLRLQTCDNETLLKHLINLPHEGVYLQCDLCDFQCEPVPEFFNKHYATHIERETTVVEYDQSVASSGGTTTSCSMQCDICKKAFTQKITLIRHLKNHEKKLFSCSLCSGTFKTQLQLKIHRKRHKRISLSNTLMYCELCKKYFKTKKGFAYHQQRICVLFKCFICNESFANQLALAQHSSIKHSTGEQSVEEWMKVEAKQKASVKEEKPPEVMVEPKCAEKDDVAIGERRLEIAKKMKIELVQSVAASVADNSMRSRCKICGKVVTTAVLPRHMILHKEDRPFTCDLCGKCFKRKSSLQDHIMIEMGMKNYVCDVCGMKFLKQGYLNKHVRYHKLSNGEFQGFACEQCGKRFSEKWRLGVHQRAVHKGGRFSSCKCDICGELFAERYMVKMHKHKAHNGEAFSEHQCPVCERKFLEKWMLKSHLRNTHRSGVRKLYCDLCGRSDHVAQECAHRHTLREVPCMLCGETFSSNVSLKEHVTSAHIFTLKRELTAEEMDSAAATGSETLDSAGETATATGRKKMVHHVCAGCGKHFISKLNLRAHETRENCFKSLKYDCSHCGKTFTSKFTLSNHVMLHKKATSGLPYQCEFCSKDFAAEESLQSHLAMEKVCLLCDAVYPCNDQLKNHVFGDHNNDDDADECAISNQPDYSSAAASAATTGEIGDPKPFECKLCGKKFMRKQAMKNHLFAEMNLRRYVCEFCDKSYNYYSHLKEHLVSSHGEKEYLCGYCGKDFPTKKRFRDHVTLHSDEKPFMCECGQSFKLSRYLNKHKKNCKANTNLDMIEETFEILETSQ